MSGRPAQIPAAVTLALCLLPAAGRGEAAAPSPAPLTLHQAQQLALAHQPQIQAAELASRAASQVVREARSGYFPQVLANATAVAAGDTTRIAASGGLNNPTVFQRESNGLLLSQLITDFGRTAGLTASARYQAEATAQGAQAVRAQVLLDVDRSFFGVLGAQALVRVAEQTTKARRLLLDRVTALAKANLKSSLDVSFAEVAFGEAKLLQLSAQDQLESAFATLAERLGSRDAGPRVLTEEPPSPAPPEDVDPLVRQALATRPELLARRAEREAGQRLAAAERAIHYPVISAIGAIGFSPYRDDRLDDRYAAAGVSLTVPLFTGGRISARATEALLRADAAQRTLDQEENQVTRDVRIAWLAARTAHEAIEVTQTTLASASRALELAQSRYELGISSIVELSQAQLQETEAEIAHARARYDYEIRRAELDFQAGLLR